MLTPLDLESKSFSKGFGYNAHEVKMFMREVIANYERLYKDNIELKDKISLLNDGIQYYKTMEETLQNALILAEKTGEETRSAARKKAEQIVKEAELNAKEIIQNAHREVDDVYQQKENLLRQFEASKLQITQFLKNQLTWIEQTGPIEKKEDQ